jgi:ribosomal protein L11 methyltransferase
MWRVELACAAGDEEITAARFIRYDVAAIESESGSGVGRAWFAYHEEALRCSVELGASLHREAERNWNATWQESEWRAMALGNRLWLAPPWDPAAPPEGRIRLDFHPGTLFGNGDHPTTQLCLEALERHVKADCVVADIGCGSGLLLEAARLLGARSAIGCDLDARAAREAGAAFVGSLDAIASGSLDVVVANIQVGILADLLPEIPRALKPGGVAILSGILEEQIEALGARPFRVEIRQGWACLETWQAGKSEI